MLGKEKKESDGQKKRPTAIPKVREAAKNGGLEVF